MANPYQQQPDHAFWGRAVARLDPADVDPVAQARFQIHAGEKVASAGSCFAQHIGRAIASRGFDYLVTETGEPERQFGVYPARFGNLYTPRQLLQLFQRAYGLFLPHDVAWVKKDAPDRLVDPFRPQIEPEGFAIIEALNADRELHLAAVRRMFETMDVFIFTLGLTESWLSTEDGAVFPLAPGVVGNPGYPDQYRRHNFTVQEICDDMASLIEKARILRPELKVILTVSPVPLIATFTDEHVLTATTYSKSVLRVAAGELGRRLKNVDYFPSYEIITGQHNGHRFLNEDLRSIRPEGVAQVIRVFGRHYLSDEAAPDRKVTSRQPIMKRHEEIAAIGDVVCDEEAIVR